LDGYKLREREKACLGQREVPPANPWHNLIRLGRRTLQEKDQGRKKGGRPNRKLDTSGHAPGRPPRVC